MTALRRLIVVLAAYGLSIMGLMFMMVGMGGALMGGGTGLVRLLPLLWLFAWLCHINMSIGWILDRARDSLWARWGTRAGVASLLSPLLFTFSGSLADSGRELLEALGFIAFIAFWFIPAIVLAVYLVRFHRA